MEWVRERDLLIAQTLAFVQSVNDKKLGAKKPDAEPDTRARDAKPRIEAAPIDATKTVEPPAGIQFNVQASRPSISSDFRAEIQVRVATFRAHQERFHREREAYFSATLARIRAATGNDSAAPPLRK
jgi:hypothetical protein